MYILRVMCLVRGPFAEGVPEAGSRWIVGVPGFTGRRDFAACAFRNQVAPSLRKLRPFDISGAEYIRARLFSPMDTVDGRRVDHRRRRSLADGWHRSQHQNKSRSVSDGSFPLVSALLLLLTLRARDGHLDRISCGVAGFVGGFHRDGVGPYRVTGPPGAKLYRVPVHDDKVRRAAIAGTHRGKFDGDFATSVLRLDFQLRDCEETAVRVFSFVMKAEHRACPICGDLLVEVEAALNRTWASSILTSFHLQIRLKGKRWMSFMSPSRNAAGLYCTKCGSLLLAPTLPAHRRELGLEP